MKILNYLLSACIMSSALVGFTGCGDDDPKDNQQSTNTPGDPNNPEESGSPNTPDPNQPVVANPITGLATRYNNKWKFNYTNGKMVGGTNNEGTTFSFGTNPFTITSSWADENGFDKEIYSNIKLNKNGYIISANYFDEGKETYPEETETWKYVGTISISYINDEYINKVIMDGKLIENGEDAGTVHNEITFTWNDGNIVSIYCKYHEENDEGDFDEGNSLTTFNYTAGQLNSGIYLTDFFEDFTDPYFWYSDLLGKPGKQVPTHVNYVDEVNQEDPYRYSYDITANYNGDATVSSLTLHDDNHDYDNNYIQFFYNGAYPNFDDEAQYQLNKAVKKSLIKRHSARRK